MTKITNKPNFDAFRTKMIEAAKELGIDMEIGRISYGNEEFSFSAQCFNGDAGRIEEFKRVSAMKAGKQGAFPNHWFGGIFQSSDGRTLKITGAKSRGRKNTLVFTDENTGVETIGNAAFVRAGRPITDNVKPVPGITQEGGVLV